MTQLKSSLMFFVDFSTVQWLMTTMYLYNVLSLGIICNENVVCCIVFNTLAYRQRTVVLPGLSMMALKQ